MMIRPARFDGYNGMEMAIYTDGYTYRPQSEHFRGHWNGDGANVGFVVAQKWTKLLLFRVTFS